MIQTYEEGMKVKDICLIYKISRKTFYKWLKRYKLYGKEGLLDLSRRPKSNPRALPDKIKKKIISVRKKTNLGPKRLKWLMQAKYKITVSEYAIYKTIKQAGLIKKYRKKHKKKYKFYSMPYPGVKVQIDSKHLDLIPGKGRRYYQYTATDDCTRLRVIRIYEDLSISNSLKFLDEVVKTFPFKIRLITTDNGIEFAPTDIFKFKDGHPFTLKCKQLGIIHKTNKPRSPTQNGKVERSHRIDEEEFYRKIDMKSLSLKDLQKKVIKYQFYYNNQRPHMGLGGKRPIDRLREFKRFENVTYV
jgi:transposase InsO family protein